MQTYPTGKWKEMDSLKRDNGISAPKREIKIKQDEKEREKRSL